ncbi:MAG: prepilin-type N-terminal cleavage/methylation domain-containing protein [Betaproteobacteria bacterium]
MDAAQSAGEVIFSGLSSRRVEMGQSGFTLIELVLVIVIIAILSGVASARYSDLSKQAYRQSVAATAVAFAAGVNLVQMKYRARGLSGNQANVTGAPGADIDVNVFGWPTDTSGVFTVNAARCQRIWNWLLVGAPTTQTAAAGTASYRVTVAAPVCTYTYLRDTVVRSIAYNSNSGIVTTTNP